MLGPYPDWWTSKDYAVLKTVEVFGTVKGRKALHKVLYFANLKGRMFKYQWYRHGPYSPDLAPTIANHVFSRSLYEDESGDDARRDIKLAAGGRRLLGHGPEEEIDAAVGWARGLLDGMDPRETELTASVHYLASCVRERGEVYGLMRRLKPAAGFAQKDADRALLFLESRGCMGLRC